MPTPPDYVTGAEMSRWMTEESDFRARLERRMADNAQAVQVGLGRIETHLAEINGRTRKNSECIAVIERELDAIKSEDGSIERMVEQIRIHGCGKLKAHKDVLQTIGWTPRKKAAVAGGLFGAGALVWPALQRIAEAVHAVVTWANTHSVRMP